MSLVEAISLKLNISISQVSKVLELLEDSTIPFIARYRKEVTGSLDEIAIKDIKELNEELLKLQQRKEFVTKTIDKQGKITPELVSLINDSQDIQELEDIYLPFKKKKETLADKAIKYGLKPLALKIYDQKDDVILGNEANHYFNDNVTSVEQVRDGVIAIIASIINEDKQTREQLRELYNNQSTITSKVVKKKKDSASKYKDYFDFKQSLSDIPSHRFLAISRGRDEGFLKFKITPLKELIIARINKLHIVRDSQTPNSKELMNLAIEDAYKRLLSKSLEQEQFKLAKLNADTQAIKVFSKNLEQLLLSPALKNKNILAVDPGIRTGCKLAVIDTKGKYIHSSVIYPQRSKEPSIKELKEIINSHNINAIAIGDGTAGRETEEFIKNNLGNISDKEIPTFLINEDGASIYSASQLAQEEFPDLDLTVRGAISIGRRLQDPMAELIKIDAKSIGVGQYQHDVDQSLLKNELEFVTQSCVNQVGVNLNTASFKLLEQISGLGPKLAHNIVEYRDKNDGFTSREELLKVNKLGAKAYQQSAGFLKVPESSESLDNTSVHPESYKVTKQILTDLNIKLTSSALDNETVAKLESLDLNKYTNQDIGLPTLEDIIEQLKKPGIDPRGENEEFSFAKDISSIDDLEIGDIIPGIVSNLTSFGAFVNIGIKNDGLLHISQISDVFISDPSEVLSLNDKLEVKVIEIDKGRGRISLTLKF